MSSAPLSFALVFSLVVATQSLPLAAQADSQSVGFLAASLTALQSASVQDVTLTVQARRIAGSSSETAPATFKAVSSGSTQIAYVLPEGPLMETRSWSTAGGRTGSWTDPTGAVHVLPAHNMMADPSWFFPALAMSRVLTTKMSSVSYIGTETFNGIAAQHLRFSASAGEALPPRLELLSQMELYLDATTLLPIGLSYSDHPDNTMLVNIPIKVLFSGYAPLGGITVPTRIEQFRNESLVLDLQVQDAKVNTGFTIPAPQAK